MYVWWDKKRLPSLQRLSFTFLLDILSENMGMAEGRDILLEFFLCVWLFVSPHFLLPAKITMGFKQQWIRKNTKQYYSEITVYLSCKCLIVSNNNDNCNDDDDIIVTMAIMVNIYWYSFSLNKIFSSRRVTYKTRPLLTILAQMGVNLPIDLNHHA